MAKKTKVRTTMTPGDVIKVEANELLDLERQGLIHSREGDDNWENDTPDKVESGDLSATTPAAARAATPTKPAETKGVTS